MRAKACAIVVISVTAGLISSFGGVALIAGQGSLADVAKQEQERRKAIKAPSKVLTNDDLKPALGPAPPVPAAGGATPGTPADAADTTPAPADNDATPEPEKDQKYWSGRLIALQSELSRNETFALALQSRINALANEYTNQGDGVRQNAIAVERQKAIADLNRVNKEIADGKKAIAALQEEARRSGVPAGWLR